MEQTKQLQDSFMPEKFRVLSGSALKVLAMVIMLIDHTAAFLLVKSAAATRTLFVLGDTDISIYRIMRDVGRAAFPIFCFLLVEGFVHTHNRFKYGRNLLIFACISEIPWDLVHKGTFFDMSTQNVFFTLFLGYLAFCAVDYYKDNQLMQLICMNWKFPQIIMTILWRNGIFMPQAPAKQMTVSCGPLELSRSVL